ncbi:histone-lysine N-methyltransferase ash1 isoform X1 [Anopheles gambiae]|uniref:histone-lysine N-methyltransferase ash1 isoform X1 n=1 Tax=Anopheles gambiae TaxID=7165 RepID=UPI002AC8A150|nr:histone-lysine N-methyltransferase ash1 isoform X1 [Anopheles gambiae]XP_061503997.1 histone-lysine N-methyltransferase ash1 isoform X1 [Anopheles gambiae]XP_061503998.1 histone-lysine N-methyltransferase ash1 isoform X1 [Anopheles gambiae]XP_061503999.1 histone-lysine N-methyltransferase ash1 isoform X1 [Anopheles gambiae]XP_061504001.1 histone-lysine N-methyltransferase ash1 isoform X1 [Anopheles gambiae]XP_061504002.1 histone-lysine N-methyltransferase ash1 isoform X1 [Anopheles gambiae]
MTIVKSNTADAAGTNPADNAKSPLSSSSSSSSSSDSDDGSDSSSDSDSSSASTSKTSSKQSSGGGGGGGVPQEKPQQFSVMSSDSAGLRMKIAIPRSQSNATPTPSPTASLGSNHQHQQLMQQDSLPAGGGVAADRRQKNAENVHGGERASPAGSSTKVDSFKDGATKKGSIAAKSAMVAAVEASSTRARAPPPSTAQQRVSSEGGGSKALTATAASRKQGSRMLPDDKREERGRTMHTKARKRRSSSGNDGSSAGRTKKSVSESDSSSASSSFSSCTSNSDSDTSSTAGDNSNHHHQQQQDDKAKQTVGGGRHARTAASAAVASGSAIAAGKKQKILKRKKASRTATSSSSDEEDEEDLPSGRSGSKSGTANRTNEFTSSDTSSSDEDGKAFAAMRTKAKSLQSTKGSGKDGNGLLTLTDGSAGGLLLNRPPLSTSTPAKQHGAFPPTLGGGMSSAGDGGLTAEGGSCSSDNELPALVSAAIRRVESGSDAESIRGLSAPTQQYTSSLLRDFVVKTQMLGTVGGGGAGAMPAGVSGSAANSAGGGGGGGGSPSSSSSSSSSSGSSSSSSSSSMEEGADPAIGSAGPGPGGGGGGGVAAFELDVRKIKTESPVPSTLPPASVGRNTPLVNGLTTGGMKTTDLPVPAPAPKRRGRPPKSSLQAAPAPPPAARPTGSSRSVTIPTVSESPDSGILSTHSSTGSPKTDKTRSASHLRSTVGATGSSTSSRRSKSEARGSASSASSAILSAGGAAYAANSVLPAPPGAAGSGSRTSGAAASSYALTSCLDRNTYATERVLYPPRGPKKRGVGRPPKKDTAAHQQPAGAGRGGPANDPTARSQQQAEDRLDPHWQKIDISKKFHEPRLSGYKSDGGHSTICCSKRLASQSGYISDYGGVGASSGRSRLSGYKSDFSSRSRRSCSRAGGYRSDYGRAKSCGYRSDCSTRHRKQVRRKRRKKIGSHQQSQQQQHHNQHDHQHHNNNLSDRKNYNASSDGGGGGGSTKSASVGELEIMFMAGLTLGSTSDEDSSSTSSSTSSSSAESRESLFTDHSGVDRGANSSSGADKVKRATSGRGRKANVATTKPNAKLPRTPRKPTPPKTVAKGRGAAKAPRGRPPSSTTIDRRRKANHAKHGSNKLDSDDEDEDEEEEAELVVKRRFGDRVRTKPLQPAPKDPPTKPSIAATASVALKQKSSALVKKPGQRGRPPGVKKQPGRTGSTATAAAQPAGKTLGSLDVLLAPKNSTAPVLPVNNFDRVVASMSGSSSGKQQPGSSEAKKSSIYTFSSTTVAPKNAFAAFLLRGAAADDAAKDDAEEGGRLLGVKKLPLSKANVIKNSEECSRRFQKSTSSFALGGIAGSVDLLARIADGTIPKASPTKSVCSKRSRRKSCASDRLEVMSVKSYGVIGSCGKIRQRRLSTMSRCSSRSAGSRHAAARMRRRKKRLRSMSVAPGTTAEMVSGGGGGNGGAAGGAASSSGLDLKLNVEIDRLSESFSGMCRIVGGTVNNEAGQASSGAGRSVSPPEEATATNAPAAATPTSGKGHQTKRSVKKRKASEHVTDSPSTAGGANAPGGGGGGAAALGNGGGAGGGGGTGKRRNKKTVPTQSPDDHKLPLKKRHYLLTPGEKGNNSDNNSGVDEVKTGSSGGNGGGVGGSSATAAGSNVDSGNSSTSGATGSGSGSANSSFIGSHTVLNPCAFASGARSSANSAATGSSISGAATKAVTPKKRHLLKSPEPGPVPTDTELQLQIKSSDSPLTIVNGGGASGTVGDAGSSPSDGHTVGRKAAVDGAVGGSPSNAAGQANPPVAGSKKKTNRQQEGSSISSSTVSRERQATGASGQPGTTSENSAGPQHRSTPPARPSVIQSSGSVHPAASSGAYSASSAGPPPGVFEPTVDLELVIPPPSSIPSLIAKVEMLDSPRLGGKDVAAAAGAIGSSSSGSSGNVATKLESEELQVLTAAQRKAAGLGAGSALLATISTASASSEKVLEKLLTKTGAHHLLMKKKRKKPNRTGFPTVKKKKKKLPDNDPLDDGLSVLDLKPEVGPDLFDSSNLTRHVPSEAEKTRMKERQQQHHPSTGKHAACDRVPKEGEPTDCFIERHTGVGRPRLSVVSLEKLQGKLPLPGGGSRDVATTPPATGGRGRKSVINPLAAEHQLAAQRSRGLRDEPPAAAAGTVGRKGKKRQEAPKPLPETAVGKRQKASMDTEIRSAKERNRSKSVSVASEQLPNIVRLSETLSKGAAAKENKENSRLPPGRPPSAAKRAGKEPATSAETAPQDDAAGVIRRTRSSSVALDPSEVKKLHHHHHHDAEHESAGKGASQSSTPVRPHSGGIAALHNEDSTSLDSMPLLKRLHSRSISRMQSVITPTVVIEPIATSPKTPGRPRGRPRTTSPITATETPNSPTATAGPGRGRPRTALALTGNPSAASMQRTPASPLSSPSPTVAAAERTAGRKKQRLDGRKSVPPGLAEPIESARLATRVTASKSVTPTPPVGTVIPTRLKRGKSDETLRAQQLEKPTKKPRKELPGSAEPSPETAAHLSKRSAIASPIVEPVDPEETAHVLQPASSTEELEHDPLPPDEGPSDFLRLTDTPSPTSSGETRELAMGGAAAGGRGAGTSKKLPRKKYITAGLFSDCYKDDGTTGGEGRSGPKTPPETLLPPPAYCERFLRRTVRDFQLPYDLWWLQENGKLPGRNSVPSWNYRKIRTNVYYDVKANPSTDNNTQCNCKPDSGCQDDCLNRMVYTECVPEQCPCGDRCRNTCIQRHEYAPGLERFMTEEKGWGIRSRERISKGTFIMEYLGEVVTEREFKERMRTMYLNDTHHYCLNLDGGLVIDGHRMGSDCRFVNHSCAPNCEMQKWSVNGLFRMALFAMRDIPPNEELCYDYNFSLFNPSEGQPCRCGSEQCRGVIGGKSQRIKPIPLGSSGGGAGGPGGTGGQRNATEAGADTDASKAAGADGTAGGSGASGALVVELSPRSAARSRKRQAKKNQPIVHLNGTPLPTFHPPSVKERALIAEHHCFLLRNLNKIRRQKERAATLASAGGGGNGGAGAAATESGGQGAAAGSDQTAGGSGKPSLASQISALRCPRNIRTRGLAFVEDDPELEKTARIAVALKDICTEIATLKDDKGVPFITKLQLPSKKKTPLYYERIPKPIDLAQIETNIEQGVYRMPKVFEEDLLIMLSNAIKYYGINSPEGIASEALKSHYYTCKQQQVPKLQAYIGEENELLRGFVPKKEPADDAVPPKPKRGRRQEQPEDIIRCICGLFKDEGLMIQCSKCLVWQHIECTKADPAVENYLCEKCDPREVNYEIPLNEFTEEGYQYYVSLMRGKLQIRQTDTVYVLRDIPMSPDPKNPNAPVRKHTYETIGKIEYSECDIFRVESLWKDKEGRRFVYGHHYLRPHETYHEPTRRFYPNEVMRVPLYEVIPIELVVDRCWVLDPITFCKGRPVDSSEPHVYICELRVDKSARLFSKISRHSHPVCMKSYAFHKFEQKLKIAKTFAPHDLGSLAHLLSIRDKQKKGSKKDDGSGGQTSAGSAAGGSSGFGGAGGSHSGGSKKMTPIIQLLPPPPKTGLNTDRTLAVQPPTGGAKPTRTKTLAEKRNRLEQVLARLMQKLTLNPNALPVVDISYLLTGRGARLRRTNNSTPVPII